MTHADRFRSMTDEELAELGVAHSCPPPYDPVRGKASCPVIRCKECWLRWLQQEVEE